MINTSATSHKANTLSGRILWLAAMVLKKYNTRIDIHITTAVLKKLNTHGSQKNPEKILTTQKIASFFCQFFAGSFLKPGGSLRVHEFELKLKLN